MFICLLIAKIRLFIKKTGRKAFKVRKMLYFCTNFIEVCKKMKIVVLAKQVPDTRNVGPDAMTPEGTVNRSALPAIFNPEDLNALEQALRLKEQNPGTTVTVLTMGPDRAAEVVKEAMYRGADGGYLLTDRAFAGADTLATSYALSTAIRHFAPDVDLIIGGRQAIDGDTAQVGSAGGGEIGTESDYIYRRSIGLRW